MKPRSTSRHNIIKPSYQIKDGLKCSAVQTKSSAVYNKHFSDDNVENQLINRVPQWNEYSTEYSEYVRVLRGYSTHESREAVVEERAQRRREAREHRVPRNRIFRALRRTQTHASGSQYSNTTIRHSRMTAGREKRVKRDARWNEMEGMGWNEAARASCVVHELSCIA